MGKLGCINGVVSRSGPGWLSKATIKQSPMPDRFRYLSRLRLYISNAVRARRISRASGFRDMRRARNNETRLVIVGDVHGMWSDADNVAAAALDPDLVIFVGDVGNEDVELVKEIAQAPYPKAVLLGNHDAFHTYTPAFRVGPKAVDRLRHEEQDAVNAQLDALGEDHIGFSFKHVPGKPVTVVGARPFSSGGDKYKFQRRLLTRLYGLRSFREYVQKLTSLLLNTPKGSAVVVVGHNGPTALGANREDICGVDFKDEAGDWGDEDLRIALDHAEDEEKSPKLVVFGHMHSQLSHRTGGGLRKRVALERDPDILYLNTAVVPRVIRSTMCPDASIHHFCLARIVNGCVIEASDVWVRLDNSNAVIERQDLLFKLDKICETGEIMPMVLNTHTSEWESVPIDSSDYMEL